MFLLLPIEKYESGKTEFNVTITRYVCVCSYCTTDQLLMNMLCRVFLVRILNLYALMAGWFIATEVCFCVCMCPCLCLSMSASILCLCVCVCLPVCVYVSMYVSLCVSVCVMTA